MVETTPTLLKKPFFKDSKRFFHEMMQRFHGKEVRDAQGNTLAHLCIFCGSYEHLPQFFHLLDVKNKEEVSPRDLIELLDLPIDLPKKSTLKQLKTLHVYKMQTDTLVALSPQEIQESFHLQWLDRLVFQERKDLFWVLKKCHKKLTDSNIKRRNQWIDNLYGNTFFSRKLPLTYVRWVDPLVGYGLFTGENLPQYSLVGEYVGVVRKRSSKLDRYNHYIFGYVAADSYTPFVIDAERRGNHTRFINHSDTPNLYSTWLIVKNVCHIILVTKQTVPQGTQLTYDYGPTYWKKRSDPLVI